MKDNNVDVILLHIEHSKPIEISELVTSLNAIGNLFSIFAQEKGGSKDLSHAKLYVEKIEEGCIDIFLCETVTAGLLPFLENMNIIFEFSSYVKNVLEYYANGIGEKPKLGLSEIKNFKDFLTVTAGDNNGEMTIGAISKGNKCNIFNNCTFNFQGSNSAQNQLERDEIERRSIDSHDEIYNRVLMQIYQVRSDAGSNTGNKAIIDDIFKGKKIAVVFETDELKQRILYSENNPTRKLFQVDIKVQTVNGIPVAYKVISLHDVIDYNE